MGIYEERVKRLHERVIGNQKKAQGEKKADKTDKKKPDTKGAKQ